MNLNLQIRDFGKLTYQQEKNFIKELDKLFKKYNITGRYDE